MTTSSSQTETYTYTDVTQTVTVTPRVLTQTEQVARYFTEDLEHFIHLTQINLISELEIPPEYDSSIQEVIEMLYDDLAHMLREGLITGIHLLLSEPRLDVNSGAYPLRYHAMYLVDLPPTPQRSLKPQANRFGGLVAPSSQIWVNARFALLIDWNRTATERRRHVHRPEYWFDWVAGDMRYDATTLVRYREGGLTYNGATVVRRSEFRSPGY